MISAAPTRHAGTPMKPDTPRPILLKDYRPPDYLIYMVNLDVSLHPTRTRVRARGRQKTRATAVCAGS